jgi:hypothetical protein
MATKKPTKGPNEGTGVMPGVAEKIPRHRVLYIRRDPGGEFQPLATFELGDKDAEEQGGYLFDSLRAEHINKARAAGAPVPFFLVQTEEKGFKVEE